MEPESHVYLCSSATLTKGEVQPSCTFENVNISWIVLFLPQTGQNCCQQKKKQFNMKFNMLLYNQIKHTRTKQCLLIIQKRCRTAPLQTYFKNLKIRKKNNAATKSFLRTLVFPQRNTMETEITNRLRNRIKSSLNQTILFIHTVWHQTTWLYRLKWLRL